MRFKLIGNIPSKKNSKRIISRNRYGQSLQRPMLLASENFMYWHVDASYQLKAQQRPVDPIKKCAICITIFAESKRAADLTNKAESIMDLLVDMGILEDDNWFIVGDIHLIFGGVDNQNPRAVIEINTNERKNKKTL